MSMGTFTAYAPPNVFSPWVTVIGGLGFAASVRIDVEPQGSTTIFAEVQYANESGENVTTGFQGTVLLTTSNCLQDIKIRLKGVPLGSTVDGRWQALSTARQQAIRTTPRGISLHLGLNNVDTNHYGGWSGRLQACENDALAMEGIARKSGFSTNFLLTKDATSSSLLKYMSLAAKSLESGDIFLLTYSGHGGQIDDVTQDEEDKKDETWVLYDRMFLDDELYAMFGRFNAGVRIVMISDSCHSGTIAKAAFYESVAKGSGFNDFYQGEQLIREKVIPHEVQQKTYLASQQMYNGFQWTSFKGDKSQIGASVIQIGACQDNQVASDGSQYGFFTKNLLEAWDDGNFRGGYSDLVRKLGLKMPASQSPNYYRVGVINASFESQMPFTIAPNGQVPDLTESVVSDFLTSDSGVDQRNRVIEVFRSQLNDSLRKLGDRLVGKTVSF